MSTCALVVVETDTHPPVTTFVGRGGAPEEMLKDLKSFVSDNDQESRYQWAIAGNFYGGYEWVNDTVPWDNPDAALPTLSTYHDYLYTIHPDGTVNVK